MFRAGLALLAVVWLHGDARADGLELDLVGARGVGRAGAVTVSEDGGAALLINPAGVVRRPGSRFQAGVALHDSDGSFDSPNDASPTIRDKAGAVRAPTFALLMSSGRMVFGAAYLETGDLARELPAPATGQPADQVDRLFPHRYGGLAVRYQRRTAVVGAAIRATDWLGVGASVHVSAAELSETRMVWAGFDGRDRVGYPDRDMPLTVAGDDWFVPGASAGLLVAPELPVEFAASVSWADHARLSGRPELGPAQSGAGVPAAELTAPSARATLASPLVVRAGARYLGRRYYVEVTGDISLFPGREPDPTWRLDGVTAVDQTGATGELTRVRSLVDRRNRGSVRAAVDVEVVEGFLFLSAGYGWLSAGARDERLAAVHPDLGGHLIAVGAEGQWEQMTLTVGYARTIAAAVTVGGESLVELVNPFDAGGGVVGAGEHDAAHDAFGAQLEIAWD